MEAIHANPHLQSSLQSILINTATANNGMKDILEGGGSTPKNLGRGAEHPQYCTCHNLIM